MITTERTEIDAIDMRKISIEEDETAIVMTIENAVDQEPQRGVVEITRPTSTENPQSLLRMLRKRVRKFSHLPISQHRALPLSRYQMFKSPQFHQLKIQLSPRIIILKS
jgi:hypothetical protein